MRQARISALGRARRLGAPARRQRGVVVFIALIVLVAMMLAGIAVMRASGGAILTAGNLAFRQNATVSGDRGLEAARVWLKAQGPDDLKNVVAGAGYYYPSWDANFDPFTSTVWTDPTKSKSEGTDTAGNGVRYVIHRMCALAGAVTAPDAPANQECVTLSDPGKGGPKRALEGGEKALTGTAQVYYRVTARIDGPKNTVSYVQVMLY